MQNFRQFYRLSLMKHKVENNNSPRQQKWRAKVRQTTNLNTTTGGEFGAC